MQSKSNVQVKQKVVAKQIKAPVVTPQVHHSGKGTRARLNTVAEKNFFKSRVST